VDGGKHYIWCDDHCNHHCSGKSLKICIVFFKQLMNISSFAARKMYSVSRQTRSFIAQSAWLWKQGLLPRLLSLAYMHGAEMFWIVEPILRCSCCDSQLRLHLSVVLCWYRGFSVGKMYSNSLLASLNSRAPLFQPGSTDVVPRNCWACDNITSNLQNWTGPWVVVWHHKMPSLLI